MKFLSVCSGIEAASVAWRGIFDALAFCEYEAFPSAVLAHRYPETPNMGDLTKWRGWPHTLLRDADILVGGTPCQAFSIAGLRNSLADDRGNLSLEFVRLANAIDDVRNDAGKDPGIILWENVPGVLSVKDNAFGNFLAALAGDASPYIPPRRKWTNAGVVAGPARTVAWIVKDAQYFGVAQRRRRVFVVASARAGFDPAAVLFECEGVRRDTPPRREKGQAVAGTIEASLGRSRGAGTPPGALSHWDGDENPHPTLNQSAKSSGGVGSSNQELFSQRGAYLAPAVCPTLRAGGNKTGGDRPPGTDVDTADSLIAVYGGNDTRGALHPVVMAHGQANAEIRTDGGAPALTCLHEDPIVAGSLLSDGHTNNPLDETLIAHSLRGEGFDASEDGTGRGTPLVPVAFSSKDFGADATEDLSPTLRAMPHHGSHANGGGQMAVAFAQNSRDELREMPYVGALAAEPGMKQISYIRQHMAVRRLTPVECERLQGFPDGYTDVPYRRRNATPDGPRYKALGNSMAVPVMAWIGRRIAMQLESES